VPRRIKNLFFASQDPSDQLAKTTFRFANRFKSEILLSSLRASKVDAEKDVLFVQGYFCCRLLGLLGIISTRPDPNASKI
jgi:hypothetical protein